MAEEEVQKLFAGSDNQGKVDLPGFKDALSKLAAGQGLDVSELAKKLGETVFGKAVDKIKNLIGWGGGGAGAPPQPGAAGPSPATAGPSPETAAGPSPVQAYSADMKEGQTVEAYKAETAGGSGQEEGQERSGQEGSGQEGSGQEASAQVSEAEVEDEPLESDRAESEPAESDSPESEPAESDPPESESAESDSG